MSFFKNKLAITVVVLSVSFIVLIGVTVKRGNISGIENGVGVTVNPIQGLVYTVNNKTKGFIDFLMNFSSIKKENEDLKKKNSDLRKIELSYDDLKNENDRLRQSLKFEQSNAQYEYKGCNIITKLGSEFVDGYVIDLGSKDGIEKDMAVLDYQGNLVGQITSTGSNWAKVQTIANENLAVSGVVNSKGPENGEEGIVKGYRDNDNNVIANMSLLNSDSKVKAGDVIQTSGTGQIYPKGIVIGTVTKVDQDMGKVMKTATIKPATDLNKLQELTVVIWKNKRNYDTGSN